MRRRSAEGQDVRKPKLRADLLLLTLSLVLLGSILLYSWLDEPEIHVWYGETQRFVAGNDRAGNPQRWVNILGRVKSVTPVASLNYTLNGGPSQPLRIGPDDRRLAERGDFNIDIDFQDLLPGENEVVITAVDEFGSISRQLVVLSFVDSPTDWQPGSYVFRWETAGKIDEFARIVDGQWSIENDTVRPVDIDYDRLLAIGDLSWRDYTITVPITFYSRELEGYLPPSNGPGVGVLIRWRGHQEAGENRNPLDGWSYMGALGWYRWQREGFDLREGLQLLSHGGHEIGADNTHLETGVAYHFKIDVQSSPEPQMPAMYRFKVWPEVEPEPAGWNFEARGHPNEPQSGSLLLVAHHVDARFGDVRVDLKTVMPAISAGDALGQ